MMRRSGFTLIEVLIAVTIVGILAGLAIANYGPVAGRARWDAARQVLVKIYQGQRTFCASEPPAGSSGANFVGDILATCFTAACIAQWRALNMDNPNSPGGGAGGTTYAISLTTAPCAGTFTVTAAYQGRTQTVNQDFLLCPNVPAAACPAAANWTRP